MFDTVGLVWLCHKARLFSQGCRHSDQTLLPQTQPLVNLSTRKQCEALNDTVKILMECVLFTTSEGIVEIPAVVENMQSPIC